MFVSRCSLVLLLTIPHILLYAALGANAATVRPSSFPYCDLELDGPIVPGDLARLKDAVGPLLDGKWQYDDSKIMQDRPLCLNSDGGSLAEAVRVAQYLFEEGIGTVIPENGRCFSACSWMFMSGYARGNEDWTIDRRMHYTAKLGFHAPALYFGLVDVVPRKTVDDAFSVLIEATALLLELANTNSIDRPLIDMDLIQRAFSFQGPENFFNISTVDHVGRWRIPVFGFDYPDRIDVAAATNACNNLGRWPKSLTLSGLSEPTSVYAVQNAERNKHVRIDRFEVIGDDAGLYNHICVVSRTLFFGDPPDRNRGAFIETCGFNGLTGVSWGQGDECTLESANGTASVSAGAIAIFSPDTRLSDLMVASEKIQKAARSMFGPSSAATDFNTCWLNVSDVRITNVNEYANMRSQPKLSAPVVAKVLVAERLRLTKIDDIIFIGEEKNRQTCVSACRALSGNDRDSVVRRIAQQCINSDLLWYEIIDPRGNRGWVSRRFLEEVDEAGFEKPDWCDKAKTDLEMRICNSPDLSDLDIRLNRVYSEKKALQGVRATVADRMQKRFACNLEEACLREVYFEVLEFLDRL